MRPNKDGIVLSYVKDVSEYYNFSLMKVIDRGRSLDEKYYVETISGEKMMLRLSNIIDYEKKEKEFNIIKCISKLGIKMSQPIGFGICDRGKTVYQLLTWCEGQEAKKVLPTLSDSEQYKLGVSAGKALKKIHTIGNCSNSFCWSEIYREKVDCYIQNYFKCEKRYYDEYLILDYIKNNLYLLNNRPICLLHGDFKVSNLIVSLDKEIYVIDFECNQTGDPYCDFVSVIYSAAVSPSFSVGNIHGYFEGEPPKNFWRLVLFYIAVSVLQGLPWALSFGKNELDMEYKMYKNIIEWFDYMKNYVPTWYLSNSPVEV